MDIKSLKEKINSLPENLQQEVEDFVDFLIEKYQLEDTSISEEHAKLLDERYPSGDYIESSEDKDLEDVKNEIRRKYGKSDYKK